MMTALGSTGCAAVFKGSTQDVQISGGPVGSDVRADGRYLGTVPVQAPIDRDHAPDVVVSKEGYATTSIRMRKKADTPWFVWDIGTCVIPITLCIPVLVDALSGAWFSYDDNYTVKLDPRGAPGVPPGPPVAVPKPPPDGDEETF